MQKSSLVLIVSAIVLIAAVGGAVVLMQDDGDDGNNKVTDVRGRTVSLPDEVDKVVCLQAGTVRLVTYLGCEDKIVGVDSMDAKKKGPTPFFYHATYRLAFDSSKAIDMKDDTVVQEGKFYNVGGAENYKAIQKTGGNVIFCSEPEIAKLNAIQTQTGIPVVGVHAEGNITVEDAQFRENLELVGKVMGCEARAKALADGAAAMAADLRDKAAGIPKADRPDCFIGGIMFMMESSFYMTTGNFLPFDMGGAHNVMPFKNGTPWPTEVNELAASGADYIFVDSMKIQQSKNKFLEDRATLTGLPAVDEDRIYSLYAYKFYGTNWETELMNAYYIGSLLHPEVYGNMAQAEININLVLDLFYPDHDLTADLLNEKQGPGAVKLDWQS